MRNLAAWKNRSCGCNPADSCCTRCLIISKPENLTGSANVLFELYSFWTHSWTHIYMNSIWTTVAGVATAPVTISWSRDEMWTWIMNPVNMNPVQVKIIYRLDIIQAVFTHTLPWTTFLYMLSTQSRFSTPSPVFTPTPCAWHDSCSKVHFARKRNI